MTDRMEEFISAAEQWQAQRKPLAEEFSRDGLVKFTEMMNAKTRQLVSITGKSDPEFWSAVLELAQNAVTQTTPNARLIVGDKNRTNL